jgi:hypothetical protein
LVARGVDVNQGFKGFDVYKSLLADAITTGNTSWMECLLDLGAHTSSQEGPSALQLAATANKLEACKVLLRRQSVTIGPQELASAVNSCNQGVLRLFLESKANMHPELQREEMKKAESLGAALRVAVQQVRVDLVQMLLAPPAHWGPVTASVLAAGLDQAKQMVEQGKGSALRVVSGTIHLLCGAWAHLCACPSVHAFCIMQRSRPKHCVLLCCVIIESLTMCFAVLCCN